MARVLIVGGGERGRWLAGHAVSEGNVARVVSPDSADGAPIRAAGAECWVGDPTRLATVVGALDGVAIACWLFGGVDGQQDEAEALHGSLLEAFLSEAVDTTMRGFVYEAAGTAPAEYLTSGAETVRRIATLNAIPLQTIEVAAADLDGWRASASDAVASLLSV
jgi:uncharacterized protein YbjT (DUF2867 family)